MKKGKMKKWWHGIWTLMFMLMLTSPSYAAITGVSIDTGMPGSLTNVTITPDWDGTDDWAFIRITSSTEGSLRMIIDTDDDGNFEAPDWGDPMSWMTSDTTLDDWIGANDSREFMFEGRDNSWRVLPNGSYSIKIIIDADGNWSDTADQTVDTSLTVTVETLSISGTISALVDGSTVALEGARVHAGSQFGWGEGITDADGAYTISGLKEGNYHLDAEKNGYVSSHYEGQVNVASGQDSTNINLTLSPSVQITGTITLPVAFETFANMWGGQEEQLWININGWSEDGSDWPWGNAHIHASDSCFCAPENCNFGGPGGGCDPLTDPNCGTGGGCDPMTDPNCGTGGGCDPMTDPNCGTGGGCDPMTDPNCGTGGGCDPMTDPNCGTGDGCDPMTDPNCTPTCDPMTDPNCDPGGGCDPMTDPNCTPTCDPMTDPNCDPGGGCDPMTDPNCTPSCDPMTDPNCDPGTLAVDDDMDMDGKSDTDECANNTTVTFTMDVRPPEAGQTKTYHIRAEAENYASMEYTVVVDENGGTQDITLTKANRIHGSVTLPEANGEDFPVWIDVNGKTSNGNMIWGGGNVEPGGTVGEFEIRSALEGTYSVEVRVWGYKTTVVNDVVVEAGTDTDLGEIVVTEGGKISGTITISGDTTDYKSWEGDEGTQPIWMWIDAWSPTAHGWSGTNVEIPRGENQSVSYTIGGLSAGTYEIHAWLGEGYEQSPMPLTATLDDDSSQATDKNMTFAGFSGSISGTVTGDGLDMAKVVVKVSKAGWGGWMPPKAVQPASDGTYTVTELGTSEFILEVNEFMNASDIIQDPHMPGMPTGDYGLETRRVSVVNGTTATGQDFTLGTGGMISGTVSLEAGYDGEVVFADHLVGQPVAAMPIKMAMMGGQTMYFGQIQANGTYTIAGLGSGAYIVQPPTENLVPDSNNTFDAGAMMFQEMFAPDIAGNDRIVTVSSGETKTGVDFELADGFTVKGTLTLPEVPEGDDWNYVCELELRHARKEGHGRHRPLFVRDFNGGTTYSYTMEHVMEGDYVVQAWTPTYKPATRKVTVDGGNVTGANLELKKGANITGKLIDAETGEAITPDDGVRVRCEAFPWVEGSWRETFQDMWSESRFLQESDRYTGEFKLANLPAGNYVVTVEAEHGRKSGGAKNYIGIRKAGVVVPDTSGATVDIGTLELKEGVTISGNVTAASTGDAIGNIEVIAEPVDEKDGTAESFTLTDAQGNYTLYGIDPDVKYYYVIAGARPDFMDFMPVTWGEVEKDVEVTSTGLSDLDFEIPAANATLSGTIHKTGSSPWLLPFSDGEMEMPAPFLLIQKQGEVYDDPMDGIEVVAEPSDSDTTTFFTDGIVPGTYNIKVFSRGYTTKIVRGVVISEGANELSETIELVEGGTVSGTVVKDDGTYPTTTEVSEAVVVSADLDVIIFGSVTSNAASNEVTAYSVSGLAEGATYRVVFVNDGEEGPDSIHVMADLVAAGDTYNAVIGETEPIITARAKKNDNGSFTIGMFVTTYLNDASASDILSVTEGDGVLTSSLGSDKMSITATYTPDVEDTVFTIGLTAHYGESNSTVTKSFTYDVNATSWNQGIVNALMGGSVGLGQGDKSKVFMEPGDVTEADGDGVTTVTMQKDDGTGSEGRAEGMIQTSGIRTQSILAETTPDLPSYATAASALYDIALPEGDTITEGAAITVSLQYDESITDTSDLHVYHYTGGEWIAEDTNKSIDTVNKTITADVTSLSPFQVAEGTAPETSDPGSTTPAAGGSSSGGGGCSMASAPVHVQDGLTSMVMMLLPLMVIMVLRVRRRNQN